MSDQPTIIDGAGNPVHLEPDAAPVFDPNDPMVEQVKLTFSSNKQGANMDISFPPGVDMDEKNILHVLAWYVANAAGQLLPIAIQSWHAYRLGLLQKPAANEPEDAVVVTPPSAIVGQDGKPLVGPEDC